MILFAIHKFNQAKKVQTERNLQSTQGRHSFDSHGSTNHRGAVQPGQYPSAETDRILYEEGLQMANDNELDQARRMPSTTASEVLEEFKGRSSSDYPPCPGNADDYKVGFDGSRDPKRPCNWGMFKKFLTLLLLCLLSMTTAWGIGSSVPAEFELEEIFHIGDTTSFLLITLYVLGIATGCLFWEPIVVRFGHRYPLLASTFSFMAMMFWCATTDRLYQFMIYRFFAGLFCACPLIVTPVAITGIQKTKVPSSTFALFVFLTIAGCMAGRAVSSVIEYSKWHWRGTQFLIAFMASLGCILTAFIPETSSEHVLRAEASRLRKKTGNPFLFASLNRRSEMCNLKMMLRMAKEPIILSTALLSGFASGIWYLTYSAFPYMFNGFGFPAMPFIGLIIGTAAGHLVNSAFLRRVVYRFLATNEENWLFLMFIGWLGMVAGMFSVAWTTAYYENVALVGPAVCAGVLGFGTYFVIDSSYSYILVSYPEETLRAFSVFTFYRLFLGATFPLFGKVMFENMHIQWAGTLLGALCVVFGFASVLLYAFGSRLRQASSLAVSQPEMRTV